MKILAAIAILALVACGDDRPAPTRADTLNAHANAASQAEKAFATENPADPAALQAAPK